MGAVNAFFTLALHIQGTVQAGMPMTVDEDARPAS